MLRRQKLILEHRRRRVHRTRQRVRGSAHRPRLSVFRSLRFTYAQLIDDERGVTLWAGSTPAVKAARGKMAAAQALGEQVAAGARALKITSVVFDRGSYRYHGRVKAVADGARNGGLKL